MNSGYVVEYSGSSFLGEYPVKKEVKTIDKIFKFAEKYKFENYTRVSKARKGWHFRGNFKTYSSVFYVHIYDKKIAMRVRGRLRNRKKYF